MTAPDPLYLRWDRNGWADLETAEKNKDNTYTYFEAKTQSFSSFEIIGRKSLPSATENTKPY